MNVILVQTITNNEVKSVKNYSVSYTVSAEGVFASTHTFTVGMLDNTVMYVKFQIRSEYSNKIETKTVKRREGGFDPMFEKALKAFIKYGEPEDFMNVYNNLTPGTKLHDIAEKYRREAVRNLKKKIEAYAIF